MDAIQQSLVLQDLTNRWNHLKMLHADLMTQGIIKTDLLDSVMFIVTLRETLASLGGMLNIAGLITNPQPDLAALIKLLQQNLPPIDYDIGETYSDVAHALQLRLI